MPFPLVLAHGAVGPLDELLPPILLGAILGLIVITWWNGRKKASQPPAPPDSTAISAIMPADPANAAPIPPSADPADDSHFPVT